MSGSQKSSLIERLVQDRLRSGDLEASAAGLLRVGEADATVSGQANVAGTNAAVAAPEPLNGHADSAAPLVPGDIPPPPAALHVEGYGAAEAPTALEVRPFPEPAVPLLSPFPSPGLMPSSLVPPPANGLAAPPAIRLPPPSSPLPESLPPAPRAEPAAKSAIEELAAPRIATQAADSDIRPDLVQGPPTIDAVALERGGMV